MVPTMPPAINPPLFPFAWFLGSNPPIIAIGPNATPCMKNVTESFMLSPFLTLTVFITDPKMRKTITQTIPKPINDTKALNIFNFLETSLF